MDNLTPLFGSPTTRWVPFFAWRPVETADYGWVWFRRIYKRRIQSKLHLPGPIVVQWQYAVDPPMEVTS